MLAPDRAPDVDDLELTFAARFLARQSALPLCISDPGLKDESDLTHGMLDVDGNWFAPRLSARALPSDHPDG
jgi:hypothetical protein